MLRNTNECFELKIGSDNYKLKSGEQFNSWHYQLKILQKDHRVKHIEKKVLFSCIFLIYFKKDIMIYIITNSA